MTIESVLKAFAAEARAATDVEDLGAGGDTGKSKHVHDGRSDLNQNQDNNVQAVTKQGWLGSCDGIHMVVYGLLRKVHCLVALQLCLSCSCLLVH